MSEPIVHARRAGTTPLLVEPARTSAPRSADDVASALRAARARSRTPTGTSREVYGFARARRERRSCRASALRDRPQPAARERADVPGREQHRARADALLQRRPALPRRARSRRARDRARVRSSTGARTTTRLQASWRASSPRTATRCVWDGHSIQAELPWLLRRTLARSQPRHRERRELRASAARRPDGRARGAVELQPRHRRPLQGRLHHAPLRQGPPIAYTRSSSRWR